MARILISHFSSIVDDGAHQPICFYDALAQSLKDQGHEVTEIVSTEFLPYHWNGFNDVYDSIDQNLLREKIRNLKPDLCVFGNNSAPRLIYEETNCPVLLWCSDTIKYFNDKDVLQSGKYNDRIFFYAPFQRDLEEIEAFFGAGVAQVIHGPLATGVRAEARNIEHNVSFIGSSFANPLPVQSLIESFLDKKRLGVLFEAVRKGDLAKIATAQELGGIERHVALSFFESAFSGQNRLMLLSALASLGLGLYGMPEWYGVASFFPEVAASYIPKRVYSLRHNEDIYNASKICLSISHTQAVDGFPWRVMDIMASNGCLLSDRKTGLADFVKGYVDLPMFESVAEAKDLARRLLSDESWRKDIVAGCQKCIEDKGRWKHRMAALQDRLGVDLTTPAPGGGKTQRIYARDYQKLGRAEAKTIDPFEAARAERKLRVLLPVVKKLMGIVGHQV